MNSPDPKWRKLAEAACSERDPDKLIRIIEELNRALENRSEQRDNDNTQRPDRGCTISDQRNSAYCF